LAWQKLVPRQDLVQNAPDDPAMTVLAAKAADDSFMLAYTPYGSNFTLRVDELKGKQVDISWFNPRIGQSIIVGQLDKNELMHFAPPADEKRGNDWVLVIKGQ